MLGALLDAHPTVVAARPPLWVAAPPPSSRALRTDKLRRALVAAAAGFRVLLRPWALLRALRDLIPGMRELVAESHGDDTSLNRLIGRDRSFAIVRDRVRTVRAIGRAHGASVNDVLLAVTACGMRDLFMSRCERIAGVTLRVLVPVSLRGRLHGTVQGNRVSQMVVPVSLGSSDSVARLRAIAAETRIRKGRTRYTPAFLFRFGIVRRLLLKAIIGQRLNVTTATLTGPRKPLFLAGARVLDLFPMLNLIGNQTIGVGVISYAGWPISA